MNWYVEIKYTDRAIVERLYTVTRKEARDKARYIKTWDHVESATTKKVG